MSAGALARPGLVAAGLAYRPHARRRTPELLPRLDQGERRAQALVLDNLALDDALLLVEGGVEQGSVLLRNSDDGRRSVAGAGVR